MAKPHGVGVSLVCAPLLGSTRRRICFSVARSLSRSRRTFCGDGMQQCCTASTAGPASFLPKRALRYAQLSPHARACTRAGGFGPFPKHDMLSHPAGCRTRPLGFRPFTPVLLTVRRCAEALSFTVGPGDRAGPGIVAQRDGSRHSCKHPDLLWGPGYGRSRRDPIPQSATG